MISTRLYAGILLLLIAPFTATSQAASPITGAFGVKLGDRADVALAQGFLAQPDNVDRVGIYEKFDEGAYLPYQSLDVSPITQTVYGIKAWRAFEETLSLKNCAIELNGLWAKLREKYPKLVEVRRIPKSKSLDRTLADGIKRVENVELADGRYILLECAADPARAAGHGSRLTVSYAMDDKEMKPYLAETSARYEQLKNEAMKRRGFDAKDF